MLTDITSKIKAAQKNPGVYIFYKDRNPLYVGKASNLKNRLKSYLKITDIKTKSLNKEANRLETITLRSNIEALIVESQLIKKLKPKYNILFRDDKNYFYISVSKEQFPRILITHQLHDVKKEYIGPFTDGNALKTILRLIRKTIPYCTHNPHFRLCLDAQINNCPGYCCNKQLSPTRSQKTSYKKGVTRIKNILTGKNRKFIEKLKDPYDLLILEKIWSHEPYLEINSAIQNGKSNMSNFPFNISQVNKIECYDNSHLSGKEAVGAMTAWKKENGAWAADKNMWRKFKIRGSYTEDDPRMMGEVVSRRLNHPEWPYPDLIIIDGGIIQYRAAQRALNNLLRTTDYGLHTKLISFAKPQQLVFGSGKNPIPISKLPLELQSLIKTAIQNTHNFVIRYHRKVRQREFLNY